MSKNYGITGGYLDGEKHRLLAADGAAYMARLAQRPWMNRYNHEQAAVRGYVAEQSQN